MEAEVEREVENAISNWSSQNGIKLNIRTTTSLILELEESLANLRTYEDGYTDGFTESQESEHDLHYEDGYMDGYKECTDKKPNKFISM